MLGLAIPGSRESSAFDLIRERSPDLPVIVLAPPDDELRAIQLIRRGAQDYALANEIDCLPLARTIGNAIERSRWRLAFLRLCENSRIENSPGRVV